MLILGIVECWSFHKYNIIQMSFNIPLDFALLLVPLSLVVTMRIELKQKLIICSLFGMGMFVVSAIPPT
jgi:hypothetical protein